MKIKSRKDLLKEYSAKYSSIQADPTERIRDYFKTNNLNLDKAITKAIKKIETIEENRVYNTVHITMYEYPMKTDRPRTFNGHTFSPNAAANHKYFGDAISQICKQIKLINTPATIQIDAYMEMPHNVSPDEVILYEAKVLDVVDTPDYDNIGKCYTDIMKNNLISDDDIFHTGIVRKFYSLLPRVEITITYIASHESDYIFKKMKTRKSVKEAIKNGMIELRKIT